jgi:acetyl esterase/lipase
VDWLAASGIASVVLRYRLLPRFSIEDSLDDLEQA